MKSNDRKERFEFEREHFIYSGVRKLAFVVNIVVYAMPHHHKTMVLLAFHRLESRHTPVVISASVVPYRPWLSLPAGGAQHSCAPHAAERLTLLLELSAFGSAFTLPAAFTFTLAASTSTLAASTFFSAASTFFSAASTAFALAASM